MAKGRKRKGRVLVMAAFLVALGIMLGTIGKDLLARAKTGAQLVKNRNVEVEVQRDIVYRTVNGHNLRLDIYRPKGETKPLPGLLLLHGGSWRSGSKEQLDQVALPMAQQGYTVANINYRLAPANTWPAQIEDAKAAVRWMRRHAAQYGIAPGHIAAVGFSAGAHLAALLGTTKDADYADGDNPGVSSRVQAVVAVSGPFDLYRFEKLPDEPGLAFFMGGTYRQKPDAYRAASPILLASKESAPFLLIDGKDDHLVLPENDDMLAAALKKHGVEAEIIRVKNAGHVLMPVDGKQIDPPYPVIILRVAEFLNRHLKG